MNFRRIISAILVLLVVLSALPALAANVTMYVISNTAKVYTKMDENSSVIATLCFGESVEISAGSGKWLQVTNSAGTVAYMRTYQLSNKNPNTDPKDAYVSSDDVPVYSKPLLSQKPLAELDFGTEVKIVAVTEDNEWVRLKHSSGYLYAQRKFFSYDKPITSASVYVKETVVTLRQAPTSSSGSTGSVYFGEECSLKQQNGEWSYISNSQVSGWCRNFNLSEKSVAGHAIAYETTKKGVKVYVRRGKALAELTSLDKYYEVEVVAFTPDGEFAMVNCGETYGYMEAKYLKQKDYEEELPPEDVTPSDPDSIVVYVSAISAKAYKSASDSSKQVGTVYFGEALICTQVNGSWALIGNKNGQGWVKKSALTTNNPNSDGKTYYAQNDGVPVYQKTVTSSKVLGKLKQGAAIQVVASNGDWRRVIYDGGYGYVLKSQLGSQTSTTTDTVYCKVLSMEAYKSASSSSKQVGTIYYGQELTKLDTSREWTLVANGSEQGWVKSYSLTNKDPNTYNETLYVTEDDTPVRKTPKSNGKKLTEMDKGDVVTGVAITPDNEWVRIKYNNTYAYISAETLSFASPGDYDDSNSGTANETLEAVIALAIEQYGKPYVYGADGPSSYDCSGLMYYCFEEKAGIKLRRSGHDQGYDDRFPWINDVDDLKRGDLVVFDTVDDGDDYSDHTGLYLGDGKFIHASSSAGKVIVSDLSSGYYNRKFSWALRVIE